jgi:hypothetical protein
MIPLLVLRTLMILGAPMTDVIFWLGGSPTWRSEDSGARLWRRDPF